MQRLFRAFVFVSLFLFSGCSALEFFSVISATPNIRVTTATYDGVIFDMDNAAQAEIGYELDYPFEHYWTPNADDVAELEARLIPYLEQTVREQDRNYNFWRNLATYKRQYFGVLKATDPYIWANYFCEADIGDWEHNLIIVADGGNCFFSVLYDVANQQFSDLRINGQA